MSWFGNERITPTTPPNPNLQPDVARVPVLTKRGDRIENVAIDSNRIKPESAFENYIDDLILPQGEGEGFNSRFLYITLTTFSSVAIASTGLAAFMTVAILVTMTSIPLFTFTKKHSSIRLYYSVAVAIGLLLSAIQPTITAVDYVSNEVKKIEQRIDPK